MGNGNDDSTTKEIKSLRTAFDIVEFVHRNDGVRASDIAADLEFAPSTIHYYLTTLVRHRFLVKDGNSYRLGLRFLTFGGKALTDSPLYPAGDAGVRELVDQTGESVQIAVVEYGRCIYIYHVPGAKPISDTRHVGTELPPHATAAGKAILSFLPANTVNDILSSSGLPKIATNTLTDRSALVQELEQIQENEVAFEHQEADDEVNAIAAPIVHDGEVLGAVELTLPTTRIHDPRRRKKKDRFSAELVELVRRTATTIQTSL